MRKSVVLAIALLVASLSVNAGEAPRAKYIPTLGVVKIQEVFKDYQYAKDQEAKIKASLKPQEDELVALQGKMKTRIEALKNNPMMRPNSKPWEIEMLEIKKMEVEFKDMQQTFNRMRRKHMAEYYRTVYAHFQAAIKKYAEYYKYDLIITAPDTELTPETDNDEDSPVALQNEILMRRVQYISKYVDITGPIIELMNTEYQKNATAGTKY
jgi:Skp family chaperone for outer membrane proteins